MTAAQLKLLLFAIFIGFSFFSWLFKQIAKKRAEAEQQRRMRAMHLQELRTGRSEDPMAAGHGSGFEQPMLSASAGSSAPPASPLDERQRKLAELRRRAAQRSGASQPASSTPSAQVLAPQGSGLGSGPGSGQGVIVLPGGVTIRVNAPQSGQVIATQPAQRQAGRTAGGQPSQQNRQPKQAKQQNRPPKLTPEQLAQQQRQQAMARQPVPRPPVSRLPVSDTPDMEETRRLNADTDAPTVTSRPGRKSPVRNLANLSERDLRTAFVLTQVFGQPKCMQ